MEQVKQPDKSTDAMLNSQEEEDEDEGDSGAEEIGKLLTIHNFSFFFFFVFFSYEEKNKSSLTQSSTHSKKGR